MRRLKIFFAFMGTYVCCVIAMRMVAHIWSWNKTQTPGNTNFYCDIPEHYHEGPCQLQKASGFFIIFFICTIILQYGITYYYLLSIVYCPKRDINKNNVDQELDGQTEDL